MKRSVVTWIVQIIIIVHVVGSDINLNRQYGQEPYVGSLCSENVFSCECLRYTSDLTHLSVIDINCSYMNFTAITLEMILPRFTERIDFSDNGIMQISNKTSLKSATMLKLFLNNNLINNIAVGSFNGLPNLEELDLSKNRISALSAGVFHGIYKLQILNIATNRLQILPQYTFQHLPILVSLRIDDNNLGPSFEERITIFGPEGLSVNPKLVYFYMNGINATKLSQEFFKPAYNLKVLHMARNHMKIIPELSIYLEVLDISSNNVSTLQPGMFNMPYLRKLVMNDLQNLREIGNHTFHSSRKLQQLSIQNCKHLKYFSPYAFGVNIVSDDSVDYKFPLSEISFLGSGLDTLDSKLLPIFSRVPILDFRGNPWRCDCLIKWMLQLNIQEEVKEFTSCSRPYKVAGRLLWSLNPDKEMLCRTHATVIRYIITTALVFLCIALATLSTWLVLLWPKNVVNPMIAESRATTCVPILNIRNSD